MESNQYKKKYRFAFFQHASSHNCLVKTWIGWFLSWNRNGRRRRKNVQTTTELNNSNVWIGWSHRAMKIVFDFHCVSMAFPFDNSFAWQTAQHTSNIETYNKDKSFLYNCLRRFCFQIEVSFFFVYNLPKRPWYFIVIRTQHRIRITKILKS